MAHALGVARRGSGWSLMMAVFTLASQRVRQAWGLLLLIALGILSAITLVCAIPLYAEVAMSAGLRGTLASYAQNGDIVVSSVSKAVSLAATVQATRHLDQEFSRNLGPYLSGTAEFAVESQTLGIASTHDSDKINLTGFPMQDALPHAHLLQGRLPLANSSALEIALRPEEAKGLGVSVGSTLLVDANMLDNAAGLVKVPLPLSVVGIFNLASPDDPFWHGNDFLGSSPDNNTAYYGALASTSTLLSYLYKLSSPTPSVVRLYYSGFPNLLWYFHLDISRITIHDLNSITRGIHNVEVDATNDIAMYQQPFVLQPQVFLGSDMLQAYSDRISIAQMPIASFLLLVFLLILFFIALMVSLLVERHGDTIALLRSRGASRKQIFGALSMQGVLLCLLALAIGPFLAVPLTTLLVQQTLPASDSESLNLLAGSPWSIALGVSGYALAAALVVLFAFSLAVLSATRQDTLALKRETARPTVRPLWQRLNLDLGIALLALVGFACIVYLESGVIQDTRQRLLLLSPLSLLQAVCLLLAVTLLLLRILPRLLRGGAWLAARRRGATSLLALAQISRTPRHASRITLLLALSIALAIFTLVFNASQFQRVFDIADYQAGADFSGEIPSSIYTPQQLGAVTASYRRIPGVTGASLGFTRQVVTGGSNLSVKVDFRAVDSNTFTSATLWPQEDGVPNALFKQLASSHSPAVNSGALPAIVDANTWNALHLAGGAHFSLSFSRVDPNLDVVNFVAIAQVPEIPTPGDTSMPVVIADYLSFARVYTHNFTTASGYDVPLNYVWLRSNSDELALASVRSALQRGALRLSPLYDRRAIAATLSYEPLNLALFGTLASGVAVALLLALIGDLVASWQSVRNRLAQFALLRALGATPRQLVAVLAWEQGIIYGAALLLGVLFGIVLSLTVLPSLVFSTVLPNQLTGGVGTGDFYAIQSVPPIRVIIPTTLFPGFALLVGVCGIALGMMIFVVARPSPAQVMRLDEE